MTSPRIADLVVEAAVSATDEGDPRAGGEVGVGVGARGHQWEVAAALRRPAGRHVRCRHHVDQLPVRRPHCTLSCTKTFNLRLETA